MGGKNSSRARFRNATALPRTRLKRMWRLGSSHCRKRRETRAAKAFRSFPSRRGAGAIGFENRDRLSIAMDWPFSNATSSLLRGFKIVHKAHKLLADSAGP